MSCRARAIERTFEDMTSFKVDLPESTASRLEEAAQRLGVSLDDLIRISVEEKLARLDDSFRNAAEEVISKNADLYKRLA